MDKKKRDALLARVGEVNKKRSNLVLVTLEEFFDGNDDGGSIWCNLESEPSPAQVFKVLKSIRNRNGVADVRVLVTQYDGDDDEWPFSDTVFIITSSPEDEVQSWFSDEYAPDEIYVDDLSSVENIVIPVGMRPIAVWWD